MKKLILISALVLTAASVFAKGPDGPVKVLSTKLDVVYFKVDVAMIGGLIQVFDADGKMIFDATVTDKKVILDFFAEPSGNYTIHVVKNNIDESIKYEKSTESHAEDSSASHITATQM